MNSQNLQNLQAIGRLQAHMPDAAGIAKLLQAAKRNLADARKEAANLLAHTQRWLQAHRPDLLRAS